MPSFTYTPVVLRLTTATSTVTAYCNSRVYPSVLPQDPVLPAITYQVIDRSRTHAMGSDPGDVHALVQVDVYDETYLGTASGARKVRNELSRFQGRAIADSNTATSISSGEMLLEGATKVGVSQSFQLSGNHGIGGVGWYIRKLGAPTGTLVAKLWDATGTHGTSAKPATSTGSVLATSVSTISATAIATGSYSEYTFAFASPVQVTANTTYCVTVEEKTNPSGDNTTNHVLVGQKTTATSHDGNYALRTSTWNASARDMYFNLYSSPKVYDTYLVDDREDLVEQLEDGERTIWRRSMDFEIHHTE